MNSLLSRSGATSVESRSKNAAATLTRLRCALLEMRRESFELRATAAGPRRRP